MQRHGETRVATPQLAHTPEVNDKSLLESILTTVAQAKSNSNLITHFHFTFSDVSFASELIKHFGITEISEFCDEFFDYEGRLLIAKNEWLRKRSHIGVADTMSLKTIQNPGTSVQYSDESDMNRIEEKLKEVKRKHPSAGHPKSLIVLPTTRFTIPFLREFHSVKTYIDVVAHKSQFLVVGALSITGPVHDNITDKADQQLRQCGIANSLVCPVDSKVVRLLNETSGSKASETKRDNALLDHNPLDIYLLKADSEAADWLRLFNLSSDSKRTGYELSRLSRQEIEQEFASPNLDVYGLIQACSCPRHGPTYL
eukprot:TRINITY_DN7022_c0_g1_i2.p1 TRINITY_DN7022_c0_g1~~TRINITY_DN7022_c0_g1_i2.p1  ORF type:complete len:321 (+),score=21.06 TRINITY_DN7022_c0_g1_i2:26-964(+)